MAETKNVKTKAKTRGKSKPTQHHPKRSNEAREEYHPVGILDTDYRPDTPDPGVEILDLEVTDEEVENYKIPVRLSSRVLAGINLYLAGSTVTGAAKSVGLDQVTLSRALASAYGKAYAARYYSAISKRLRGLHVAAVEVVAQELRNPEAEIRLKSAALLLKHIEIGKDGTDAQTGQTSATAVAKALLLNLQININAEPKNDKTTVHVHADSNAVRSTT